MAKILLIDDSPADIRFLTEALKPSGRAGDGAKMGEVSILAHRMRGSSALYGYPQLSTLAGLLERLLDSRPELRGEQAEQFAALLGTVTVALREGINSLKSGGTDRDLGLLFTRMGGSQQLQDLVRTIPDAFRVRAPLHRHAVPEEAPEDAAEQAAPAEGIEGELRMDVNQTSRVAFSQASARLRRWGRERSEAFDLNIEGDDVLVESTVLQRIVDPLMHLLTNAVHHGLRSPEARANAGKPERGQIWIRAVEQQNFLEVTVADDGDGLNYEQIKERTLEKGLRSAQELNAMRESELARLILLPGLSTAQAVGSLAGRGVGTAFTLRLPTTQRIMDVLEVQVGPEQWAAFPVNAIRALRDVEPQELISTTAGLRVNFEGEQVPVVSTHELWGWSADPTDLAHLVIMSTIGGLLAVRIEAFGRIEEVSVTPPGPVLSRLEYLSGMTVDAAGEVVPILDPAGLLRLAARPDAWLRDVEQTDSVQGRQGCKMLLVDDSLSVRRLVSRMLERGGFVVETANDGQEALDMLQLDESFAAVITDLEMPRMNGYELLTALRNRPASVTLPVMIMTTRAGEKHQQVAFQLGANDYFTKPVNEALLLRRLGTLLGKTETLA